VTIEECAPISKDKHPLIKFLKNTMIQPRSIVKIADNSGAKSDEFSKCLEVQRKDTQV
jgi:hypothetical protein